MSNGQIFAIVISIEVLSEDPIPADTEIDVIVSECIEGEYSGDNKEPVVKELNGKEAADALKAQGSSPAFFMLTDDGEDLI